MNKGPINGKVSDKNARIMWNNNFSKLSIDKSWFSEFLSSFCAGCSKCGGEKAEPLSESSQSPERQECGCGGGPPKYTRQHAHTCVCRPILDHTLRTVVFHLTLHCEHFLILKMFCEKDFGSLCGTDSGVALLVRGELKVALVGPNK